MYLLSKNRSFFKALIEVSKISSFGRDNQPASLSKSSTTKKTTLKAHDDNIEHGSD
jgi:hypothetical protein